MVMPVAARSFGEALEVTAEVYIAAGRLMKDAGKLAGVADEGGYWPDFSGNEEALEYLVRAIEAAGYRPGDDVGISLDIAAAQFREDGGYRLTRDAKLLDADALGALLVDWTLRYPIVSIEDPFEARDRAAWRSLTAEIGTRVQIVADDLVTTQAARIDDAASERLANAALLKPNQCGTLTETVAALKALRAAGWHPIVSARSGETEDVTIVHLAVGWEVGQLKVGSFARSERMAKWNEALRIEDALGGRARFAGPPEPPPES
jgi:enolase